MTVSCHDAYPSIHVALKITDVSCSTHQQVFKQQLAPWSVTSEVSTPDPSFRVEFLRSKQHNYLWKTQLQRAQEKKCRIWSYCRWYSAQFIHKIQGTVESSFYMLRSTHRLFRNVHDVRLHTSRIGHQCPIIDLHVVCTQDSNLGYYAIEVSMLFSHLMEEISCVQ